MFRTERPLDNPINWSFHAGRLFGIDLRIHVTFVLCAVVLVWMEIPKGESAAYVPLSRVLLEGLGTYGLLFGIVLLHEFGHCAGARYTGGEADEILLWPLGGLASVHPPRNPAAHLITTVAGPTVNVLICMWCTAVLIAWTGSLGAVPWNPLHPMLPLDPTVHPSTGQVWVIRLFGLSYFLLLVNLLPIFPFDGGRIVQELLWPRKGYRGSMEIATSTGMIGAIAIGLLGLFAQEGWLLLMIAVFGYLTCYRTRLMLRDGDDPGLRAEGYDSTDSLDSYEGADPGAQRRPSALERRRLRNEARRAAEERSRQEEHDRAVEAVLRKISVSGLSSLTPEEKRTLEAETERRRRESSGRIDTAGHRSSKD